ncbi:hypothetical protein ACOKM5_24370 [Streptomyces sp. BH097]|uniref:hypothetical protein n=1 Tax=Streptomyces sp. BH097 TaxID=3410406 RepID=UPI003CF7DD8D
MLSSTTRDQLAAMLRDGATNRDAARTLGIDKSTAARYRAALGIGPAPKRPAYNRSPLTVEEKFLTYTRPVDGGHMEWTGRHTSSNGTPVFTHRERTYTARSIGFRVAAGRAPEGYVTAECGYEGCVAPDHLADEPGRNRVRAQLGALLGRKTYITECTRGHDVNEHRRYSPNGAPYCATCHQLTKRARLEAAA